MRFAMLWIVRSARPLYSTLPLPTEHRALQEDSNKRRKKENAANKQCSHLEDNPDYLAPANQA
jgi:hypothetical protein